MPRFSVFVVNHPDLVWDVLATGNRDAGVYRLTWDGTDESGVGVRVGMYYARLSTAGSGTLRSNPALSSVTLTECPEV